MSSLTPAEIEVLRKLPKPVRDALARTDGPGWLVPMAGDVAPILSAEAGEFDDDGWAWLPVDSVVVLDVARAVHGGETMWVTNVAGCWPAASVDDAPHLTCSAPTPREAVLYVLAAGTR